MYYFDRMYLLQYLRTGKELQVYVDKEYLTIADASDLIKDKGIGYKITGESKYFDYRDIVQIKTGETIFTIDQLNASLGEKPEQEKPKDTKDKVDIDPEKKESFIINKDTSSPHFGTRGLVERTHGDHVFYKTWTDGKFQTVSCNKHKVLWE